MRADLHSHTIFSDGDLSVKELLTRAKKNNVDILAITDHDCFEGSEEGLSICKDMNIRVIYGIELSTKRNGESIHVLGYYNHLLKDGEFYNMLVKQRMNRKERAYKILKLLKEKFNIDLNSDFINNRHSITRGTIANEIVKQFPIYNKKDIFARILGDECPCYIPSTRLTTEDGIKMINESGGMSVIAHPCLYNKNDIEDLLKLGVKGIEAVYPRAENRETKFRDLARKYNVLVTGGSDFHRPNDLGHGDVGDSIIKDQDLKKFLKVLENEY